MNAMDRCLSSAIPSRVSILGRDLLFVLCMNTVIAVRLNYGFQTGGTLVPPPPTPERNPRKP